MAGESYGVSPKTCGLSNAQGRYLPIFASAVYDNNKALVAAGKEPINLQSVMIGVSPPPTSKADNRTA